MDPSASFFGRLAALVLAHRGISVLVVAVVAAACLLGAPRLYFDFRFTGFLGSQDPAFQDLDEFVAAWGRADERVLLLARVDDGTLLDEGRLEALADALAAVEATEEVLYAVGLPHAPRTDQPAPGLLDLRPLVEVAPKGGGERKAWNARLLAEPDVVPALLSRDGRHTAAFAKLGTDTDDILAVRPAVEAIRLALEPHQGREGIEWLAGGIPAVRADLVALLVDDTVLFGLLSFLAAAAALLLMFRGLHGVVVPLGSTLLPVGMLYGVMGWAGEPIGMLSQAYVTLLPAIAIADGIHLVARFHEECRLRTGGGGPLTKAVCYESIVVTLASVGRACLFTSLTTAVGFASLAVADMRVLRSFGLYAALGVLLCFVTMIVVVPLLLSVVRRVSYVSTDAAPGVTDRLLVLASRVSLGYPKAVVGVTALVAALAAFGGSRVEVNNWLRDNLTPDHPTQIANDILDQHLGGTVPLDIDLRGPPGSLHQPAALRASREVEEWARGHPEVRAVVGPGAVVERLHGLLVGKRAVPDDPALVRQLLVLAEGQRLDELVLKDDGGRGHIFIQLPDTGGKRFEALAAEAQDVASRAFANLEVKPVVSGLSYVAYRGLNRLSGELVQSIASAFLVITAMLAFLFRSVRLSLLSLIPNALPLLFCLGAMAPLGWDLNPTSSVVFSVALGIAVDDTIHLIARMYEGKKAGLVGDELADMALRRTGRALFITSLILGVGFGINGLSAFRVNRWFGVLGALAIASAFLMDVLVLPALLKLFGPRAMRR